MNNSFIDACWCKQVDRTPVWLMRQAGRYLPEYAALRSKYSFLELCETPELAVQVTIQPVDILGVDAAILFSDILTPVQSMGMKLHFTPGPVFENPVSSMTDVDALRIPCIEQDVSYVLDTIKILRRALDGKVPLIGFGGAPFTLACYMVEGKGVKDFFSIKRMLYTAPDVYTALMDKITTMCIEYLNAQIAAGAQVIQIFDTWGGILSPSDYRTYVLPHTTRLINGLNRALTPVIHFVMGAGTMLDTIKESGADVIGLDWHVKLSVARDALGPGTPVQGNLDPAILVASQKNIEYEVKRILEENAGRTGFIFNLGHGILPTAPVENVKFLVECVHRISQA